MILVLSLLGCVLLNCSPKADNCGTCAELPIDVDNVCAYYSSEYEAIDSMQDDGLKVSLLKVKMEAFEEGVHPFIIAAESMVKDSKYYIPFTFTSIKSIPIDYLGKENFFHSKIHSSHNFHQIELFMQCFNNAAHRPGLTDSDNLLQSILDIGFTTPRRSLQIPREDTTYLGKIFIDRGINLPVKVDQITTADGLYTFLFYNHEGDDTQLLIIRE